MIEMDGAVEELTRAEKDRLQWQWIGFLEGYFDKRGIEPRVPGTMCPHGYGANPRTQLICESCGERHNVVVSL